MTVSSEITSITIPGNGVQTAFNFNFNIPSAADGSALVDVMVVGSDGSVATLTPSSYIITGLDNSTGGTVVYPISGTPLQSGQNMVIQRAVPYVQNTAVANQSFYPHTLENVADWLTFQTQQLAEVDSRALQFLPGDTGIGYLPPAALRKGLVLGFDATTGKPVAVPGGGGGGGSSAWAALTGVPNIIQAIDVLSPLTGKIIEFTGAATAHLIDTPAFVQNFNYSALTSVPTALSAITGAGAASAGKVFEWTSASAGHYIPTPSGGGGGISGPGSTVTGALVTWNSAGGTIVGDSTVVPSANAYSLLGAANYAAMRGLLGIGAVGLLGDLSTVLVAGTGLAINTSLGVSTVSYTGGGSGATSTTYIGQTVGAADFPAASPQTLVWPGSTNVGDLAVIILGVQVGTAVPPSGFSVAYSSDGGGGTHGRTVAWKVLTTSDLAFGGYTWAPLSSNGACNQAVLVYRGPTNVSLGAQQNNHVSPISIPGFNKVASNIGTLSVWTTSGGQPLSAGPAAPFSVRLAETNGPSNVFRFAGYDAIGSNIYVDGTAQAWTWTGGFSASAVTVELRNDGLASGVFSVNGRGGAVVLTATDIATGLGSLLNSSKLVAGTGVTFSYNGGTDQLTINAPGGGGGVSSFNGRTGAVSLGSGDLAGMITAGAGISINYTGSTYQVINTAMGGGGVPINYNGAAENSITPAASATQNTTNLNNLIASLNAAGGGTIWINGAGNYQINGTINLKSNVNILMDGGAYLKWVGGGGGTIVSSSSTDVLIQCVLRLNIDEGAGFTGIAFNLHSVQYNDIYVIAIGSNTGSVFVQMISDSTAGQFSGGGRNTAFNRMTFQHRGECQYGMILGGLTSGFGGQAQVITDTEFHDCQFNNVVFRGIKINDWTDTITFSGNTFVGLSGANGYGLMVNEGRANNFSVYNLHFEHFAVDTFGSGLNRGAIGLFESKQIFIHQMYQDPSAELGFLVNVACASYLINLCTPGANTITQHTLGFSSVSP